MRYEYNAIGGVKTKSISQPDLELAYAYDDVGNIVAETKNGMDASYKYDKLGQLIRVNDPHENATWVYTYDLGGNILSNQNMFLTLMTVISGKPVTRGGCWTR